MSRRVHKAVTIACGYAFEALLLVLLWYDVPGGPIGRVAGFLQIPSAIFAMDVPPPSIYPNGKRDLFIIMFVLQGALFGKLALMIQRSKLDPGRLKTYKSQRRRFLDAIKKQRDG